MPAFLTNLPWKWLGPVLGALALIISITLCIVVVRSWASDLYAEGQAFGEAKVTAQYEAAKAVAADQALERLASRVEQGQAATNSYLKTLAARDAAIVQAAKELEAYAQTPAGATVCLDADGVRVLNTLRDAALGEGADPSGTSGPR